MISTPGLGEETLDARRRETRDALGKETEGRKQEIRRLNREIVHSGDVRSDAMVVTIASR